MARPRSPAKVEALKDEARGELARVLGMGGGTSEEVIAYMKRQLVASNTARLHAIETGETKIVGVNAFTTSEASPLSAGTDAIMTVKDDVEFSRSNG